MRKVVLVLGIIFMAVMLVQSFYVGISGDVFDSPELSRGGAVGKLGALMLGVGAAFVLTKPYTAMFIFAAVGVLSLVMALPTGFEDLLLWGFISLILALMSFFSWKDIEDLATLFDWVKERFNRLRSRFQKREDEDSTMES